MIVDGVRRAALATFPVGTPLVVVASAEAGYVAILRERADGATAFASIDAVAEGSAGIPDAMPHVLLEGLDDVDDPVALLRAVATLMPEARLFALIANAAHLPALSAFFSGVPLARAHPLVAREIEPLITAGGYQTLAMRTLIDDNMPAPDARLPTVMIGAIGFDIAAQAYEGVRAAAYFVIADRR